MNGQIQLFATPKAFKSSMDIRAEKAQRVKAPDFLDEVMAVFERHPGRWSNAFDKELWRVFYSNGVSAYFADGISCLSHVLDTRRLFFKSAFDMDNYAGFTTSYRLKSDSNAPASDVEWWAYPKPEAKQKRLTK